MKRFNLLTLIKFLKIRQKNNMIENIEEKKMENLVNKVEKVLDINVTSYRISKITGITELVLSKYRKGTYKIENMSLETADKLLSNISEIEKYAK